MIRWTIRSTLVGIHEHVAIFASGARLGEVVMRQEELENLCAKLGLTKMQKHRTCEHNNPQEWTGTEWSGCVYDDCRRADDQIHATRTYFAPGDPVYDNGTGAPCTTPKTTRERIEAEAQAAERRLAEWEKSPDGLALLAALNDDDVPIDVKIGCWIGERDCLIVCRDSWRAALEIASGEA